MKRRRLSAGLLAAALLSMTVVSCGGTSAAQVAVGKPAPLFDSFDLTGAPVRLTQFRGHEVLINFWASWCIPCKQEFPLLQAALTSHPGLVVIGVVHQDSAANARSFMHARGATWAAVVDPNNQIAGAYRVNGIPVTIAVDSAGIVRARHVGVLEPGDPDGLVSAAAA